MNAIVCFYLTTCLSMNWIIDHSSGCVRTDIEHDRTCRDVGKCIVEQPVSSISSDIPKKGACMCLKNDKAKFKTQVCGDTGLQATKGQCFPCTGVRKACRLSCGQNVNHLVLDRFGEKYLVGVGYLEENPNGCGPVNNDEFSVIPRAEWGAREPREIAKLTTPVSHVVIHHTSGNTCTDMNSCKKRVNEIQRKHMYKYGLSWVPFGIADRWDDIGYSFLVGQDGHVYEGRGWENIGSHTRYCNSKAYGISVIGNFMSQSPNSKALKAVDDIIALGIKKGYIVAKYTIHGHKDSDQADTDCPGDKLYAWIRSKPNFKKDLVCDIGLPEPKMCDHVPCVP